MDRAVKITAQLFLGVSELAFRSEDAFVDIDAKENETPKQDTNSTEVVTGLAIGDIIDIASQRNTNHVWYGLRTLYKTPCPRKVSSTDLLIHIHLESVVVSANEDAIDPDEYDITTVPVNSW